MESIEVAGNISSGFLKTVLSSVASSTPLDVVIIYQHFCGLQLELNPKPVCFHYTSQEMLDGDGWYYRRQLEMFRDMYKTREFRLVLCVDTSDSMVEHGLEILGHLIEAGKVMGGLFHLYEPLVIVERRVHLARRNDFCPGWRGKWYVPVSAL